MEINDWRALGVQTFGLPPSLLVPIAAATIEDLERYVGRVVERIHGRACRVNAVLVMASPPSLVGAPLWSSAEASSYAERLHPYGQVWVHVDYEGYRRAWTRLGMAPLAPDVFLDHVQNRAAIRLRAYSHPYVRLCPVSRRVNTSGGSASGGEGMEKDYLRKLPRLHPRTRKAAERAIRAPVVLADPMDLTKMLNIPPGTQVLPGVAEAMSLFYV